MGPAVPTCCSSRSELRRRAATVHLACHPSLALDWFASPSTTAMRGRDSRCPRSQFLQVMTVGAPALSGGVRSRGDTWDNARHPLRRCAGPSATSDACAPSRSRGDSTPRLLREKSNTWRNNDFPRSELSHAALTNSVEACVFRAHAPRANSLSVSEPMRGLGDRERAPRPRAGLPTPDSNVTKK